MNDVMSWLAELDRLRVRMGAPQASWDWKVRDRLPVEPPRPIFEKEVSLEDLKVGEAGTLTAEGVRVFLYIMEPSRAFESLASAGGPDNLLPRFHVAWCRKLDEMKRSGRFERYVATDEAEKSFKMVVRTESGDLESGRADLHVCRLCLSFLNWRDYRRCDAEARNERVRNFSRREFLETHSTHFEHVPSRTDETARHFGYTADWNRVSKEYRKFQNWRCERCGVDCTENQGLLDTHHRDGVVSNNAWSNLRALCKSCHVEEHPRWYRISDAQRKAIETLRKSRSRG
ncbi:HNH endonuclease [Roseomonas sp. OT10]|uniref:HNH endonuclease signature motif containing protein n=1 Tax=Roseomonas cutis TaxID=2897332 RepID=UPI001E591DE5|nr:HNH endonuclease signature motif containing protein [Roseomonas sp. OT10]UFN48776.1 HNH endonuclease [Roseomonas sp. OT10]